MRHLSRIRLALLLPAIVVLLLCAVMVGQDDPTSDPNDVPLGDVARNMRKKATAAKDVIDDDNLSQVMRQAESRHTPDSVLKFLMSGESKNFQVAAPDVSCSLSFSANTKALLSSQYAQMDLPSSDVSKLEGPATIEGDALTVSIFNDTDWHVSEVAVALTVVKKVDPFLNYGDPSLPVGAAGQESQVRPERKPDTVVIYRMRAAAPPFSHTVFSAPLNLDLAPGDEWHWAIVQAKGYAPESYTANLQPTTTQNKDAMAAQPTVPASLLVPQDSTVAPVAVDPR
jgi:hypothetical protein